MMYFNTSYAVTISLEELEKMLPESVVKLIIDKCHVESICDLYLKTPDNKTLYLFSCEV